MRVRTRNFVAALLALAVIMVSAPAMAADFFEGDEREVVLQEIERLRGIQR